MEIYLIRHTTPCIEKGICYGQTDLDVQPDLFLDEVRKIQSLLPHTVERYFSSPLKRCSILAEKLGNDVTYDERLKELDFGKWEGKKWDEISEEELSVWGNDFVNQAPPDGENYNSLHLRTCNFLQSVISGNFKSAAIITHAGNIRSILSFILGLPLENSFRIAVKYGTVAHIKTGNYPELISISS